MKKGKVFTKKHIVVTTLAVLMAVAVWLNMKFSAVPQGDETESDVGNLSNGQYLSDENLGNAVQVSNGVSYIMQARADRNKTREESLSNLNGTLENSDLAEKDKKDALQTVTKLSSNAQKEIDIETVIKAKGFEDALVMVADDSVTVIVPSEGLLPSQTLQIQDAVTGVIDIDLEKIKIISVK